MAQLLSKWKITYPDRLVISLLIGVICGTAAANLLSSQLVSQAGFPNGYTLASVQSGQAERRELLMYVCRQREIEVLFGWIIGLTVFSAPCFYLMAAYTGAGIGLVLSVTTFQRGMMGLPCYLLTLFPQILIYLPIWICLASWAGEKSGKIRVLPLAGLMALAFGGAVLETYMNPYFIRLL